MNSYLGPETPGALEKITLAYTTYLTKAHKPLVSLRPPAVRVRKRGGRGGKLSNCLGQQTTVLVCATAVPTKGSERFLATRPQSRARGRRTKAAATSGCYSLQAAPHQASAEAQHSRQDARERRRGGHHRRL